MDEFKVDSNDNGPLDEKIDSNDNEPLDAKIDFMMIYNTEEEESRRTAESICTQCEARGLKGYMEHRDRNKDINRLEEFITTVKECKYILVLFDKHFSEDNFNRYAEETAFKQVMDTGLLARFIPIAVGVPRKTVPRYIPNFCLMMGSDIEQETGQLERLAKTLRAEVPSMAQYFGVPAIIKNLNMSNIPLAKQETGTLDQLAKTLEGEVPSAAQCTPDSSTVK